VNNDAPKIDPLFYEVMSKEDDLGVVIRAHIHIESTIIEYINQKISDLKSLRRLRFGQRLELACELGLSPELKAPLKILGDLRNDFAHKINAALTDEKIRVFFDSFDTETQQFFQIAYESTGSSMLKDTPGFSDLSLRDKFTIMTTVLKARVVIELSELSGVK